MTGRQSVPYQAAYAAKLIAAAGKPELAAAVKKYGEEMREAGSVAVVKIPANLPKDRDDWTPTQKRKYDMAYHTNKDILLRLKMVQARYTKIFQKLGGGMPDATVSGAISTARPTVKPAGPGENRVYDPRQ